MKKNYIIKNNCITKNNSITKKNYIPNKHSIINSLKCITITSMLALSLIACGSQSDSDGANESKTTTSKVISNEDTTTASDSSDGGSGSVTSYVEKAKENVDYSTLNEIRSVLSIALCYEEIEVKLATTPTINIGVKLNDLIKSIPELAELFAEHSPVLDLNDPLKSNAAMANDASIYVVYSSGSIGVWIGTTTSVNVPKAVDDFDAFAVGTNIPINR